MSQPIEIDRSRHDPSLLEMFKMSLLGQRDRLCMVREPRPDRAAGLAVMLMGHDAIRDLGPLLKEHVAKLPDAGPEHKLSFKTTESLANVFNAMEKLDLQWQWSRFDLGPMRCLVVLLVGPSVTDALAQQLTAAGCLAKLK